MQIKYFAICAALLSGCGVRTPDEPIVQELTAQEQKPVQQKRITVTRIDVFRDTLAYSNERGVYIITDTKTGQEFIGVSGIGVSELGAHSSGKTTTRDER
jgi:hypothetical protein